MRTSSTTSRKLSAVARTDSVDRLSTFLRAQHPVKTADSVAAKTGIDSETVQKWLTKGCAPSWTAALALFGAYGLEALCAAYGKDAPAWVTTSFQNAELARCKAEREALDARIAELRNR
ncbi:hypothetical protein [Methylorubrum zatmanii]